MEIKICSFQHFFHGNQNTFILTCFFFHGNQNIFILTCFFSWKSKYIQFNMFFFMEIKIYSFIYVSTFPDKAVLEKEKS